MSALELAVEAAGWIGAAPDPGRLSAVVDGQGYRPVAALPAMNVVGAAGFIVNGWWHGAVPSAVLNVIWMVIGGTALWRISAKRRSSTSAM
ncbi:MAG: CBU_0592 family membrane protein [Sphingomicrobium sp.]